MTDEIDQTTTPRPESRRLHALVEALASRTWLLLGLALAFTAVMVVPLLTMAPDTSASTEPSGDVFTARDRIDEAFVSSVHATLLIAEHESGDVLTVDAVSSLLAAEKDFRASSQFSETLFEFYDVESDTEVNGVLSIADLIETELKAQGLDGISAASDEQVKLVGSTLIDELGERSQTLGISAQSVRNGDPADGGWTVPAIQLVALSDNEALGFGNTSVALGGDTDIEEFDRDVQAAFRVDGWQVNGVAIDVNLTSQEQGALAGPFIGFTILAVLVLVGLTFRSYWVLASVSIAFLALIVWLKGISNLIGLKDDLVLSLIVPVAMISFGVDFAFHAIGRFREERAKGRQAPVAIVTGLSAVSGALLLALVSDATAFLANLTSGIESINQFGVGAAIALASAYLLLGVVTPLVVARIEAEVPLPRAGARSTVLRIFAGLGAAAMTMASVLLLVFILPWLGVVLAVLTVLATGVVPFLIQRRKAARTGDPVVGDEVVAEVESRRNSIAGSIGSVVAALARRPVVVLPVAIAITGLAAVFAIRVPVEFDVEDFFSSDTDFVMGLNQLDTHVGDRGGEPAQIYIEGDLTNPVALALLAVRIDEIRNLDTPTLSRDEDGLVAIETGIFEIFDNSFESDLMAGLVEAETGVSITDTNSDGIPDSQEQVQALLGVAGSTGVPFDETRLLMTPDGVNTVTDGERTILQVGVIDSRVQESVAETRKALEPIAAGMSEDLGGSFVQVTGSALVREASLEGTSRALLISLPVALGMCLLISTVFLRSIRYGLASILPILMVVAWLYAFMYLTGFAINLVTATIAAVSVGIGIDFAIHFIARYREELELTGRRSVAVRTAGEGTGLALVASAFSSAIGFGILALAPMPLFAAYGLLTALMIVMALVATLAVLPAILFAVTSDH